MVTHPQTWRETDLFVSFFFFLPPQMTMEKRPTIQITVTASLTKSSLGACNQTSLVKFASKCWVCVRRAQHHIQFLLPIHPKGASQTPSRFSYINYSSIRMCLLSSCACLAPARLINVDAAHPSLCVVWMARVLFTALIQRPDPCRAALMEVV